MSVCLLLPSLSLLLLAGQHQLWGPPHRRRLPPLHRVLSLWNSSPILTKPYLSGIQLLRGETEEDVSAD